MALRSALLHESGFRHAFFTRQGGVSPAPWATLSFSVSVGDAKERVRENLNRAARFLAVDPRRLYMLSQVHGTASRVLRGDDDPDEVIRSIGDVTLSGDDTVACGVRSADCVPVLIADRESGAVAAVHSGWRGTVADAAGASVIALRTLTGSDGDLIAAIGPHIEACCFEVGDDVAATLASCSSAGESAVTRSANGRAHVDLRRIVRAQLEAKGVPALAIDDVPGCSVCDVARFHSYRRDGARSGRMLSAIVARPVRAPR